MPWSPTDLVASLLYTWVLGLAPALIARRVSDGPLSRKRANLVAGVSCVTFAILALILKGVAGEPNPRISPAWILVFIVSRWIMIRGDRQPVEGRPLKSDSPRNIGDSASRLSQEEIVNRLREIVADPSLSEKDRKQAQVRLNKFQRRLT